MPGERGADDRRPFAEQLRLAEALLAEDRAGETRQLAPDPPHAAAPHQPLVEVELEIVELQQRLGRTLLRVPQRHPHSRQ